MSDWTHVYVGREVSSAKCGVSQLKCRVQGVEWTEYCMECTLYKYRFGARKIKGVKCRVSSVEYRARSV